MRVIILRKQDTALAGDVEGQLPQEVQEEIEERRDLIEGIEETIGKINEAIEGLSNAVAEVVQALQEGGREMTNEDLEGIKRNLEEVSRAAEEAAQAAEAMGVARRKLFKGRNKAMRVIALRKQMGEESDPNAILAELERKLEELKSALAEDQKLSREIREAFEKIGRLPVSPEEFVEEFQRVGREAEKLLQELREVGILPGEGEESEIVSEAGGTVSIISDDDVDLREKFASTAEKVSSLFPPLDEAQKGELKQAIEDLRKLLEKMEESIEVVRIERAY